MTSIPQLAKEMKHVLTTVANQFGRATGFVQRQSPISGSVLVQATTFTVLANPSPGLTDFVQVAADLGVLVSPQAFDQRLTEAAAQCLELTLGAALRTAIRGCSVGLPLLERFTSVAVHDGTVIQLPPSMAERWSGCGGTAQNAAACKLQIQLDLRAGSLRGDLFDGSESDRNQTLDLTLPPGSMRLADLGYWDLARMQELSQRQIRWLARGHTQTKLETLEGVRLRLLELLTSCETTLDLPVWLGPQRLPARLLAQRVPQEVADQRRRRLRKQAAAEGRTVSATVLALAAWTVFVTNASAEELSLEEALVLGRLRWQIELLFKLWKSHGNVDTFQPIKLWRQICEWYAKLLAMVITHWMTIVSCWDMADRSLTKAAQAIRERALVLAQAMHTTSTLETALARIATVLVQSCHMNPRKSHPNAYQLLLSVGGVVLA